MPEISYTAVEPQSLRNPKTRWFPILIVDVFLVLGALAFLTESGLLCTYSSALLIVDFHDSPRGLGCDLTRPVGSGGHWVCGRNYHQTGVSKHSPSHIRLTSKLCVKRVLPFFLPYLPPLWVECSGMLAGTMSTRGLEWE